ncbi:MAG: LysR family transcriptional regulator [Alphaproteobacteria bacterium]|nr:LysR family transcriptional regulator [Alphaproteobacteria bacterium]
MKYHLPSITSLQAFEAAARHLNLYETGLELNTSASDVDYHIQQLEKFLGYKLIVRGLGEIKLTGMGKAYLPSVHRSFDILSKANHMMKDSGSSPIITLHVPICFMTHFLAPHIGDFNAQYPHIELRVSTKQKTPDLERDSIDCSIIFTQDQHPHFLTTESLTPVCARSLIEKEGKVKKLNLEDMSCFTLFHHTASLEDWDHWISAMDCNQIAPSNGLYFKTEAEMLKAVRQGLGICLLRDEAAQKALEDELLINPFPKLKMTNWGYAFVSAADTVVYDPLITCLQEWLVETFGASLSANRKSA